MFLEICRVWTHHKAYSVAIEFETQAPFGITFEDLKENFLPWFILWLFFSGRELCGQETSVRTESSSTSINTIYNKTDLR